ncbi:MAG TPA: DinB family protein [Terriglobales bacterium]|jgi:uncharacterized damage-inducible protein DinB
MRKLTLILLLCLPLSVVAQDQPKAPTDLRGVLLEQLKTTHNVKDWYVPINVAVEGLTPEQAKWTDGKGNHSVGQLANHLLFWNRYALAKFKGQEAKFDGNNDETFNAFDAKNWPATVKALDDVMNEWEKAVETADEQKLKDNASEIAHIGAHNAYHIGEMVVVRKAQGSWNPEKGVK